MKRVQNPRFLIMFIAVFTLALASFAYAQETSSVVQDNQKANLSQEKITQVSAGQKVSIEGAVVKRMPDGMILRSWDDSYYKVVFSNVMEIKEKKSNPFRGSKKYSEASLVPGLGVELKGIGTSSGTISATEIKFRNDDFLMAQTMDTRVEPVEGELRVTQTRLGEAEQNAMRLSGQVQELSNISNAARGGAKAAQETADNALIAANNAKSSADYAQAGVKATNERITSLDDYDVKLSATIRFKAGSVVLSPENKEELEKLAEAAKSEKGYLIEVTGFASADGDEAYNRQLSQRRADAVIHYLAENYSISLRRFITPMGY
jgi:outer membrane protein OmpA-like peptidoglycan-associated protein